MPHLAVVCRYMTHGSRPETDIDRFLTNVLSKSTSGCRFMNSALSCEYLELGVHISHQCASEALRAFAHLILRKPGPQWSPIGHMMTPWRPKTDIVTIRGFPHYFRSLNVTVTLWSRLVCTRCVAFHSVPPSHCGESILGVLETISALPSQFLI